MIKICLCLLLFLSMFQTHGQSLSENELKAAFLYRFSQFSKWPPPPPNALRFCVVGNHELFKAVSALLHTQNLQQTSTAIEIPNHDQVTQCDVLFLSQQNRQQTKFWLSQIDQSPVLIVADTSEGFRQGAMIGIIADANNLSFRVNLTGAKRRGLSFSAHLLKLASEVR
ncbi:YfiR family protein [Pseudoalteromonas sp. MMG022]|uniref:YfiR family protein n=1 Tax=Pseudoalteromonas sp. MMG022 TaxID=2909978 RepID=UPI001F20C0B7|nr:YfiR family protein [Pseudoalteromonas sp. MMG022]MCF6434635.1 YfiR family protein [Pseudoalteromonas sp. MMG022]